MKFSLWLESVEPPWVNNGIGKNKLLPDIPVVMMDIRRIKPDHGRNNRPPKPIDPNAPYEPLIVDKNGVLQDGYHRYYHLIDAGYKGKIPVVIYTV